jgi:hypothetical protein
LGEAGIRAILTARWIGQAEHLDLFNQKAGDGIAPYFESLSGGPIKILELMHNDLGLASGEVLGACDLQNLETLSLSNNPLGDAEASAIFRNPTLTNLAHVQMQQVGAGPQTARAIAENPHLRSLKTLWLGDTLGAVGAELLAQAPYLASLRMAHLGGIAASEQAKLSDSPHFCNARITTYS